MIDRWKVAIFIQSSANNRISITDLRDKMRIDNFRQRVGKIQANQGTLVHFGPAMGQNSIWLPRFRLGRLMHSRLRLQSGITWRVCLPRYPRYDAPLHAYARPLPCEPASRQASRDNHA